MIEAGSRPASEYATIVPGRGRMASGSVKGAPSSSGATLSATMSNVPTSTVAGVPTADGVAVAVGVAV